MQSLINVRSIGKLDVHFFQNQASSNLSSGHESTCLEVHMTSAHVSAGNGIGIGSLLTKFT